MSVVPLECVGRVVSPFGEGFGRLYVRAVAGGFMVGVRVQAGANGRELEREGVVGGAATARSGGRGVAVKEKEWKRGGARGHRR